MSSIAASDQLLEALGLPLDTDVIEWHKLTAEGSFEPVVPLGSAGWRYLQTAHSSTDRSAVAYDDTAWPTGAAPFGHENAPNGLGSWPDPNTEWDVGTDLWVRRDIPLTPGQAVRVTAFSENAEIYWNGTLLGATPYASDPRIRKVGPLTVPDGLVEASNVLAVKAADDDVSSGQTYLDVLVEAEVTAFGWQLHHQRSAALVSYTTSAGRRTPLENTSPLQASVQLARTLQGDALPTVGERFRLTVNATVADALGIAEDERPRFTGTITDIDVIPDRQDPDGIRTLLDVTGVGRSARLGSTPIEKLTRGAELDGERIRRILYAARILLPDLDIGTIDPGTSLLLPLAAVNQSAKSLVDDVIADTLGQLVEHRSGRLDWHDAEHRRDQPSRVSLSGAQHLIKPFKWSQALGTVLNIAEVRYGDDPQAVVTIRDPQSVNDLGPYGVQLDTQLQESSDASSLASTIVGRYARPAWLLPNVTLDIVRTAGATAAAVLSLSHGDKVTSSGLPPDGAFESGALFVEGTTETFTRTAWRFSLVVADPAIAGVGLRWIDVAAGITWDDVADGLTWLDAATATTEDLVAVGDDEEPPPPPPPTYDEEVFVDAPLVYWEGNDTAGTTLTDSSGNTRPASFNNSLPTWGVTSLIASDPASTAVQLDNDTNRTATCEDAAWMDVGTMTLEAWIKPTSTSAQRAIMDRDEGSGAARMWKFRYTSSGKLQFLFWDTGGTLRTVTGATTLAAGVIAYVVATYDGTAARLYVNGVEDGSLAVAGSIRGGARRIAVGRNDAGSGTDLYAGALAKLAIYDHALAPTRITAHWNAAAA